MNSSSQPTLMYMQNIILCWEEIARDLVWTNETSLTKGITKKKVEKKGKSPQPPHHQPSPMQKIHILSLPPPILFIISFIDDNLGPIEICLSCRLMNPQEIKCPILDYQEIQENAIDMPSDQRHEESSHGIKDVVIRRCQNSHENDCWVCHSCDN